MARNPLSCPGVVKVHVGIPCAVEGFPCSRRVRQLHARRRAPVSHPAGGFPTRLRKLEERYGVLLFHRNKRSVRLSELGERRLRGDPAAVRDREGAEPEELSASSAWNNT